MSVNSKMTAIADKIRSLLGLTGTMGLDAMANNLGTANTHVADALAALTEKGVDSTGKGLADLAALIAAIEAGAKLTYGEITTAEDVEIPVKTMMLPIEHGLGEKPNFAFIWLPGLKPTKTWTYVAQFYSYHDSGRKCASIYKAGGASIYIDEGNAGWATDTELFFYSLSTSTTYFRAGTTMKWIAAVI